MSADEKHAAHARRLNGVEFVMVGGNERTVQSARKGDGEGIGERHFVRELNESGVA